MWGFPRFTSGEREFNLSWSSSKVAGAGVSAGAGAEVRIWASRTVLRIRCKLSLKYMGILVAVTWTIGIESFALEHPTDCLEDSDSGRKKESRRSTEKRVIKKRFWQRRPWPRIKVIWVLIFILKSSSNIGKFYVSPIQMADLRSRRSTEIHFLLLLIHFWVLSIHLQVFFLASIRLWS